MNPLSKLLLIFAITEIAEQKSLLPRQTAAPTLADLKWKFLKHLHHEIHCCLKIPVHVEKEYSENTH
jgi:hypothetical protein